MYNMSFLIHLVSEFVYVSRKIDSDSKSYQVLIVSIKSGLFIYEGTSKWLIQFTLDVGYTGTSVLR